MQKQIVVGGFNEAQRQKELEKIKTKYTKKGYTFVKYIDNGALKSVAIFEVDDAVIRKEKSRNMLMLSAFFLILSVVLYFRAS